MPIRTGGSGGLGQARDQGSNSTWLIPTPTYDYKRCRLALRSIPWVEINAGQTLLRNLIRR